MDPDHCAHAMEYYHSEGCYICSKCGMASNEPVLEETDHLPYVEGIEVGNIAARMQASHYVLASKDDARNELCSEEEKKVNQRILQGFTEFSERFSEVYESNIHTYNRSSIDIVYVIWKLFYRDQETFMKHRKRVNYFDALGYWAAVISKDAKLMSKYATKKFQKELNTIIKNKQVAALYKFPSKHEIIMIYGNAWIGQLKTEAKAYINTLFEHAIVDMSCEPRDLAAGILWKLLTPLSMFKDGVRITQKELGRITGSKPSTFVFISKKIV